VQRLAAQIRAPWGRLAGRPRCFFLVGLTVVGALWVNVTRKKTTAKKALSRTAPARQPTAKLRKSSNDVRRAFGRAREEALFPAPSPKADLPGDYSEALRELKARIQQARLRTVLAANAAMIQLYWDLGQTILDRQAREGWGAKVIDRLSHDLRQAFPDMAGLSPRNLKYMRAFAAAWPDRESVQRVVAQIPWRQNIALLERLDDRDERTWYAQQTIEHGWSQPVLVHHIDPAAIARGMA
jgi:predicted nuclease of restriction endonuclease-like (RecB) superfamily